MLEEKLYYRPVDLKEALALLQQPGLRVVPLAGGRWLIPRLRTDVDLPGSLAGKVDAVVDLADLGLGYVRPEGTPGSGWLHLGATTLLAELVDDETCRAIAGGLLAEAARREGPVNLRNIATIAGSVLAGEPSSELLLVLLALEARAVIVSGDGAEQRARLADLLADPPAVLGRGLITELCLPWPNEAVRGGLARVARTPADSPIVAASAVVDSSSAHVAIGGATQHPVLLRLRNADDLEETLEAALVEQEILSDFRGSAEYRQAMANVVGRRALTEAQA